MLLTMVCRQLRWEQWRTVCAEDQDSSSGERCTRLPSDGTGIPCHSLAQLWVLWGPPPTTISKWPFCFPASGSSELAKPIDLKNYNFYDVFICVLFQKANSQLRSTHSAVWIPPLMSDSPFVRGSPLPLLHLFREEREEHPRKDCTSVQRISSLCTKKLQHCFMEAKQEESIIVTQG